MAWYIKITAARIGPDDEGTSGEEIVELCPEHDWLVTEPVRKDA